MPDEALADDAAALRQIAGEMRDESPAARPAPKGRAEPAGLAQNLETIMRIPITVKIVLGSATMPVADLAKLGRGAVIPLDRRVGEPVDVVVNGRIVARGEVVVTDDDTNRFGIALTEVVGPQGGDPGG